MEAKDNSLLYGLCHYNAIGYGCRFCNCYLVMLKN